MPKQNNEYMTADDYKALLHKATNGSVKLLGDFRTLNGTYKYFCESCRLAFWNRAYHMLSTDDTGQNHVCRQRYATVRGNRISDSTTTPALR